MNIPSYISWKRVKYSIIWLLLTSESAFAAGVFNRPAQTQPTRRVEEKQDEGGMFDGALETLENVWIWILYIIFWSCFK